MEVLMFYIFVMLWFRYNKALDDGKNLGIRKSYLSGAAMLLTMLVVFSSYALAFWYVYVLSAFVYDRVSSLMFMFNMYKRSYY